MKTTNVVIICPTCSKQKRVPIPEDIVKEKESGATSVFIPNNLVCEHGFYAYIDKNFAVRDYLALDYSSESINIFEKLKTEFNEKFYDHIFDYETITKYINESDLKSILYGCFLKYPLILRSSDIHSEGMKTIFGLVYRLYPNYKSLSYMDSKEYIEFSKENEEKLKNYVVYNIDHKLMGKKPFGRSEAEGFSDLIDILKNNQGLPENIKLINAKNWLDIIFRFSSLEIINQENKIKRIISQFKNEYPTYSEFISNDTINLMKKRNEILEGIIELST